MSERSELVRAGRVGRPHGLDGSFYVEDASDELAPGTEVTVAGTRRLVEHRGGTDARPLIRLEGLGAREAAAAMTGEQIFVAARELEEGEYLAADLVDCEIPGIGRVRRVIGAPSCDILEVGEQAILVPLISDAIVAIDLERRVIEVDREFLGIGEDRDA